MVASGIFLIRIGDLSVKYITKHGSLGLFDGIENEDTSYEWALFWFETSNKKKGKKASVGNALQGLLVSFKITRKKLLKVESDRNMIREENESILMRLTDNAIKMSNHQANETILKKEKCQMQIEIDALGSNSNLLKSSVEMLSGELEEVKTDRTD